MGHYFFPLPEHLFCLSHHKTCWTLSEDNVVLYHHLGTSKSMVSQTFFPWCKPKWSHDEFNSQSQNFTRPQDDFMIHGVNNVTPKG